MKKEKKLNNFVLDLRILAEVTYHLRPRGKTEELIEISARIKNNTASESDKTTACDELVRLGKYIEKIPNEFELHKDFMNLKLVLHLTIERYLDSARAL
jgi:hypothetical protein